MITSAGNDRFLFCLLSKSFTFLQILSCFKQKYGQAILVSVFKENTSNNSPLRMRVCFVFGKKIFFKILFIYLFIFR